MVVIIARAVAACQMALYNRLVSIYFAALCNQEKIQMLCDLGKYHGRNIHNWDGGNCDFHSENGVLVVVVKKTR